MSIIMCHNRKGNEEYIILHNRYNDHRIGHGTIVPFQRTAVPWFCWSRCRRTVTTASRGSGLILV